MAKIHFSSYNASDFFLSDSMSLKECAAYDHSNHTQWINIRGISDKGLMQEAAEAFGIHPLALEDIANARQRAKVEEYGNTLYVVLRMFYLKDGKVEDQQISFLLRDNQLVTFRESDTGAFSRPVSEKLKVPNSNIRKNGEDYLLYSLLDVIIDNYAAVLENLNERMEKMEQDIFKNLENKHLRLLQELKSDVLYLRKNMLPARDLINDLLKNEVDYFEASNKYYLRDLQDHMQRNAEEIDFQWEQLKSLMDLYYSLQNHRMNNVMKTLTTVSFVLLPLTFIATIYGMNFKYMPRVDDPYGFWEVIGGMGIISSILLFIAIRRNWISSKDFRSNKRD